MKEFKEEIKKRIDEETEVLIFSNSKLSGCVGDINDVVKEIASVIFTLSQQSGVKKKEIMQVIRQMLKELH